MVLPSSSIYPLSAAAEGDWRITIMGRGFSEGSGVALGPRREQGPDCLPAPIENTRIACRPHQTHIGRYGLAVSLCYLQEIS